MRGLINLSSRFLRVVSLALLGIAAAPGAHAGPEIAWRQLIGDEILIAFGGRTLEGQYADGRWWSEVIRADGTTAYQEGERSATGVVRLDGSNVCFAYPDPSAGEFCFSVWRRSENCFDVYASDTSIAIWRQVAGLDWDARFWHSGGPSTCPAAALS